MAARAVRIFCLVTLLLPGAVHSFQPLVTDDTGTQGAGGNQVEAGYFKADHKDALANSQVTPLVFVYTRGLTEKLDLAFAVTHLRNREFSAGVSSSGAANPVVGLKWRFYEDEERKLSLALKPELRFAVSDGAEKNRLDSDATNARLAMLLSRDTDFGTLHANIVLASNRYAEAANRAENRGTLWRLSAAPVFELSPEWKVALDGGLVTNPQKNERAPTGYLELGAIYTAAKGLDLAVGFLREVGRQGHSSSLATVGLTWQFK